MSMENHLAKKRMEYQLYLRELQYLMKVYLIYLEAAEPLLKEKAKDLLKTLWGPGSRWTKICSATTDLA